MNTVTEDRSEATIESQAQDRNEPLFSADELEQLRSRWHEIQGSFVDEPRHALEQADALVDSTVRRLAEIFAAQRTGLENGWTGGQDVSTEDLRQALRRYRSFFNRLLAA